MKVAIVHDWLVNYGGAELFVEYVLKMYPDADIYTLVYDKKKMGNHFLNNKILTEQEKAKVAPYLIFRCENQ